MKLQSHKLSNSSSSLVFCSNLSPDDQLPGIRATIPDVRLEQCEQGGDRQQSGRGSDGEWSPVVHGKGGWGLSLGVYSRLMTQSNLRFHVIRSPVCRMCGDGGWGRKVNVGRTIWRL